ncbi:MAG TPA: GGDEF domain-containing protein [Actinomycetales bacterium]
MTAPDQPVAPSAGSEPSVWDAAAVVLAVIGAACLATTAGPTWAVVLLLAAAASGFGTGRRRARAAVSVVAVLGLAAGAVRWGSDRELRLDDPLLLQWVVAAAAVVAALALAAVARARRTDDHREVVRALSFAQDVAVHDQLTGLANRRGLALLGGQILESARRRGDAVYCIFVDVDGLSRVNSELGQSSGDEVLLTVAEALRRTTRATDAVARWGDDEFVVIGPGTGVPPVEMERRVRAHCVEHGGVDRQVWQARVSAGGSVLEPWDDGTIETMLHLADREMHVRRALRREAGGPAYRPTRLEPSSRPPHPRNPGSRPV